MSTQTTSFQEAIKAATLWCNAWERGELSDEVLADRVAELVSNTEGTRGFFVVSMTSDSPLMDRLPDPLIYKLREAGELVIDITVRNLAMSSAMAIHHQRNSDKKQQLCSERITSRCIELLRVLEPNKVKEILESLLNATQKNKGEYVIFLNRWNYDKEQKMAINISINSIAKN